MARVEALNHAIKGLPEDRIRFHLCWGSWHGPHTTDVPMRDIVDVMLAVNCRAYSFEAANVRHEHEWRGLRGIPLPGGQVILPGGGGPPTHRGGAPHPRGRPHPPVAGGRGPGRGVACTPRGPRGG